MSNLNMLSHYTKDNNRDLRRELACKTAGHQLSKIDVYQYIQVQIHDPYILISLVTIN